MRALDGPISRRLRRLFGRGDRVWHPGRPASPTESSRIPPGVVGYPMTGRTPRKDDQR